MVESYTPLVVYLLRGHSNSLVEEPECTATASGISWTATLDGQPPVRLLALTRAVRNPGNDHTSEVF
jgi:hypothetical protein